MKDCKYIITRGPNIGKKCIRKTSNPNGYCSGHQKFAKTNKTKDVIDEIWDSDNSEVIDVSDSEVSDKSDSEVSDKSDSESDNDKLVNYCAVCGEECSLHSQVHRHCLKYMNVDDD